MTNASTTLSLNVVAKDEASKVLKDVENSASGLGKTLQDVGKIASGFLAANVLAGAGQKALDFFSDSIKYASDLGESMNAVKVIFGESSNEILDWGKNNASSFGLSQRSFNEFATPLGAMLKNAGLDDFAGQTIDLTKRAADMASVFNTDVGDALTAIQAAIRGETDPIERYGVSLTAAAVQAKALAMGAQLVNGELSAQDKTAARLAIIMEQTNAVQGDFANTSDQLANKTRIQQARMEELQATIGTKLLPVQLAITDAKLKMVEVLVNNVIPALESLYARYWPGVQKAIEDIRPVLQFFYEDIRTRVEGAIQIVEGLWQIIDGVVSLVDDAIHGRWASAWGDLEQIARGAVDLVIGTIEAQFGSLPNRLYNAGRRAGNSLIDGIKDAIAGFVPNIPSIPNLPSLSSLIPSFDVGTPYVPRDMLAMVHQGEAIIPASQNRGGGGVTINVYGSILAERDIERIVRDSQSRGGLSFGGAAA